MQTVNVNIPEANSYSYPIYINDDISDKLLEYFSNNKNKAVLVTNDTIWGIYQNYLEQVFEKSKINVSICILPDGEKYKNFDSLNKILTCAFDMRLERNDFFIAFGGGVIGDMTGFAASIYLRGINFIQIPTTLLAQVDSSVGGKVAINNSYGKNLIGSFYQPNAVFIGLNFLKTLSEKELLTGLSEVVKYAFIEKNCTNNYSDFLTFLNDNVTGILNKEDNLLANIVEKSCELKASVVNQDEKEQGLRMILNLGHTIGHALEKTTKYELFSHGEAVAIGLKAVFLLSKKLKQISDEYYNFSNILLNIYNLNYSIPSSVNIEQIMQNLIFDKKIKDGKLRFVLPVNCAEVEIFDNIDKEMIFEVLKELY